MSQKVRLRIFWICAAGFACIYFLAAKNLPPWGHYRGPYGDVISSLSVYERHATDVVNAIDYDYRGFDTLAEEFILFTSVLGVMMLLRPPERKATPSATAEESMSPAVQLAALPCFAILILFGLYMSTHGQLTPGGGFQGGVIIASAPMLVYVAEHFRAFKRITSHPLVEGLEAAGAAGYAVIGVTAFAAGVPFLTNWVPLGVTGKVFSSGTIAAISACVGLEVATAFLLLSYTYLAEIIADAGKTK